MRLSELMQPSLSVHSPDTPYPSRTFRIQTETSTSIRSRIVSNSISTTLRQTYYGNTTKGNNLVFLELLDFQQTDASPLAGLLADLNPVNNQVLLEVSRQGSLLAVANAEQIEAQWQGIRPGIVQKYGKTPDGRAFITGFEQQLHADTLLASFRHKGPYGVLLPGLFSPVGPAQEVRWGYSERLMQGFFGSVDLPLRMNINIPPDSDQPVARQLRVTGELDADRFDEASFSSLVKQAMDLPNFRVAHQLSCQEEYSLDAKGWLTSVWQELTFSVENFYHQHIRYELTQL